jgi:hypothetical protein
MKTPLNFLLLTFIGLTLSFCSCQKENDHGMVIVSVKFNGKYTTNPTVYMKAGTLTMPTGSYKWDKTQAGGEDGKATFENLAPGNYYFYAKEYGSSSYVTGGVGVTVVSRYRMNVYEPTIDLK